MTVAPERRRSRMAARSTSALTGSRPVKGSSRISSLGSGMTAAMNCTRWLMPLLRVSTRRAAQCARSKRVSQAATPRPTLRPPPSALTISAIGIEDIDDHADGGGLAAPIGTDKAEDTAFGNGEREVVHGGDLAEGLGDF